MSAKKIEELLTVALPDPLSARGARQHLDQCTEIFKRGDHLLDPDDDDMNTRQ